MLAYQKQSDENNVKTPIYIISISAWPLGSLELLVEYEGGLVLVLLLGVGGLEDPALVVGTPHVAVDVLTVTTGGDDSVLGEEPRQGSVGVATGFLVGGQKRTLS